MPTPNTYPLDIAFGHDGKLWFSAFQGNGRLAPNVDQAPRFSGGHSAPGQMNQDGNFFFFSLPSPPTSPAPISGGPEGNTSLIVVISLVERAQYALGQKNVRVSSTS